MPPKQHRTKKKEHSNVTGRPRDVGISSAISRSAKTETNLPIASQFPSTPTSNIVLPSVFVSSNPTVASSFSNTCTQSSITISSPVAVSSSLPMVSQFSPPRSTSATSPSSSPWASGRVSQFSSPKKSDGLEPLIAYVHQLSPTKRNKRNTLDYCTLLLQTNECTKEALLYSKNKRSLLEESELSRTPVKIQRFTHTEDGSKVVINDMTTITQPLATEYAFQFQLPTAARYPKRTVVDIHETKDWELISFSGKVLNQYEPTIVGAKKLQLAEYTFGDTTGNVLVNLWADMISKVERGKVYDISPIQVRSWNGVKKLSTTPNSVIKEISEDADLCDIPLPEPSTTSDEEKNIHLAVNSIRNIDSVETVVYCISCQRRLLQASGGKYVQCPRFSSYMRAVDCVKKMRVQLIVNSGDEVMNLTVFEDILEDVCPGVALFSEAALAEHLLDMTNIDIMYNPVTHIINKIVIYLQVAY